MSGTASTCFAKCTCSPVQVYNGIYVRVLSIPVLEYRYVPVRTGTSISIGSRYIRTVRLTGYKYGLQLPVCTVRRTVPVYNFRSRRTVLVLTVLVLVRPSIPVCTGIRTPYWYSVLYIL